MQRNHGVALLVVLMLIAGLLVVGQMAMLLLDSVTQRSGTFRRTEQGQYCAEEGLNLGRAWVMQNAALTGSIDSTILSGPTGALGSGLLTDPSYPEDFTSAGSKRAVPGKDLCVIGATAIGGVAVTGLAGLCRLIPATGPNANWCGAGAGNCAMYRLNLIDDMDETPTATNPIDPYTDHNSAFFIRSECMAEDVNSITAGNQAVVAPGAITGLTNWTKQPMDEVAFVEVREATGLTQNPGGKGL